MAAKHTEYVFDAKVEWQTPSHKLLAVTIAFHADKRGVIRLTQEELGDAAVLSRRRVASLLDDLCELGVIARLGHGRYGLRWGLPQETLSMPKPKKADKEAERLQDIAAEQGASVAYGRDGRPVLWWDAEKIPGIPVHLFSYDYGVRVRVEGDSLFIAGASDALKRELKPYKAAIVEWLKQQGTS